MVASRLANTVALQVSKYSPYVEGICTGSQIMPGMLVRETAFEVVTPHELDGLPAEHLFAYENVYEGKEIDEAYPVGDRVMCRILRSGDLFWAWYTGTAALAYGDFLFSNGDGYLKETTLSTDPFIAASMEVVSGTPGLMRLKVRII